MFANIKFSFCLPVFYYYHGINIFGEFWRALLGEVKRSTGSQLSDQRYMENILRVYVSASLVDGPGSFSCVLRVKKSRFQSLTLKEHYFADLDALGKPGSGQLIGNFAMFGSYCECTKTIADAHYCTAFLSISSPPRVGLRPGRWLLFHFINNWHVAHALIGQLVSLNESI